MTCRSEHAGWNSAFRVSQRTWALAIELNKRLTAVMISNLHIVISPALLRRLLFDCDFSVTWINDVVFIQDPSINRRRPARQLPRELNGNARLNPATTNNTF